MAMASTEYSNWAWLTEDLLHSIRKKLVLLSDHIRFSAVCSHWHSVTINNQKQKPRRTIKTSRPLQLPVLMIPTQDNNEERRSLYSITDGKIYDFQLPVPYNKRCSGSSHGWLAIDVTNTMAITLFNPFSSKTIYLPPLMNVVVTYDDFQPGPEYYVDKVVLSADPSLTPYDYEVMAIYSDMHRLAYIKSGDKSWTFLHDQIPAVSPTYRVFSDVIHYNGQFYAVNNWGRVVSVSVSTSKLDRRRRCLRIKTVAPRTSTCSNTAYLVESSEGDLLLIRRDYRENIGLPSEFKVYKLLDLSGKQEGVEVKNLGGDVLFLGDNYSMSVSASDFPECRPNSIYYTDDCVDDVPLPLGPCDMGVFNLEDGSFERHYVPDPSHKYMPPPIWIHPNLHGNWI